MTLEEAVTTFNNLRSQFGATGAYGKMVDRPEWGQALGRLPGNMRPGIVRYVLFGVQPGDFLCGVIANDLRKAVEKADEANRFLLHEYVAFFYNAAPQACWGSQEALDSWRGMYALQSQ